MIIYKPSIDKIKALIKLVTDEKTPDKVRLAAAKTLLDRAYGNPHKGTKQPRTS